MRWSIILLSLLFFSCKNQIDDPEVVMGESEVYVVPDPTEELNRLLPLMEKVQSDLDSLQQRFEFKKQDLAGHSYYHLAWHGRYSIADDALMAGADSAGNYFMISNVRGGIGAYDNYAVELYLPDTTYRLDTTYLPLYQNGHFDLLCACTWERNFHTGPKTDSLGKLLSDSDLNYIKGKFLGHSRNKSFELIKRDLPALKDTYRLSVLIKDSIFFSQKIDSLEILKSEL